MLLLLRADGISWLKDSELRRIIILNLMIFNINLAEIR